MIKNIGADIQDAVNKPIRIHAQVWKGSNPVIGAVVRLFNNFVLYMEFNIYCNISFPYQSVRRET